jgi:nucleotide-binding universal stress UspA family protein
MNPLIVVLGLVVVALLFVAVPVGVTAFASWRRPVRLTCPRAGEEAQLRVVPLAAAAAALLGRRPRVERCSNPNFVHGCREGCLALPEASRRPVPLGTPPPHAAATSRHTILVPLDGRPDSENVLPLVASLARIQDAAVHLVRIVTPPGPVRSDDGVRVVVFSDEETERLEGEARAYLAGIARRLDGAIVTSVVRVTEPITGIVDEAEAVGADLIVMARHRRPRLTGFVRRGVVARLRRATRIPTLVVPYGARSAA